MLYCLNEKNCLFPIGGLVGVRRSVGKPRHANIIIQCFFIYNNKFRGGDVTTKLMLCQQILLNRQNFRESGEKD